MKLQSLISTIRAELCVLLRSCRVVRDSPLRRMHCASSSAWLLCAHLGLRVVPGRDSPPWPLRQRRQPRKRQQPIVRCLEEIEAWCPRARRTFRHRHKQRRVARRMNRNIRRESRSASGLFNNVRDVLIRAQVHPSQADSAWSAGMVQSILPIEA